MSPLLKLVLYGLSITNVILTNEKDKRNETQRLRLLYQKSRKRRMNITGPRRSRPCSLHINESMALKFSQLTKNNSLNIVDLRLYADSVKRNRLRQEQLWAWSNSVGREILSILSMNVFQVDPEDIRTLTVGRSSFDVIAYESPEGCASSEKKPDRLLVTSLLKGLFRKLNAEHELCFASARAGKGLIERTYTCCRKPIREDTSKLKCYINKSQLTHTVLSYLRALTVLFFVLLLPLLVVWLRQSSLEAKYSRVTESPMSFSSIICELLFKGYGPVKGCVRRSILVCVITYIWLGFPKSVYRGVTFLNVWFIYWAFFYPFSDLFKSTQPNRHFKDSCTKFVKTLKWYAGFDVQDIFRSGYDYNGMIKLITVLFNIKRWKTGLQKFYEERLAPRRLQCPQGAFKFVGKYLFWYITALSCFVYVTVIFFMLFWAILFQITVTACKSIFKGILNLERNQFSGLVFIFQFLHKFLLFSFMLVFGCIFLYSLPAIILFFFAGLILNAVYYVPYIAFFLILTFYSWISWKSFEEKYFSLKIEIYEVCKANFKPDDDDDIPDDDDEDDDFGSDDNEDNTQLKIMTKWKYNNENEPMISKQLYDEIRKRLLPHNLNLFHFGFKILCVFFFSYFLFTIVKILASADISKTVKILTAIIVSTLPYIFNVFTGK